MTEYWDRLVHITEENKKQDKRDKLAGELFSRRVLKEVESFNPDIDEENK